MEYKLYYLKLINNEKTLEYERDLKNDEFEIIDECNKILSTFNMFCSYYDIFKSNLNDLEKYLKKVESLKTRIHSAIMMRNIIIEINKLVINFAVSFRNYLEHYEITIKELNGENSREYKDFKKNCSDYFDKYFEYRFLYNLRHYIVHYRMPVSKMNGDGKKQKRTFIIEKENLQNWKGWKSIIKEDIEKLTEDIDVSLFLKKCKDIIIKLNKDISYYNEPEVLGALRIMKKYEKNNETPYLVDELIENDNKNFNIISMYNEYIISINNILKLGIISCSRYDKEYGFQFFDPFDCMFTKEEKKKFGLS